MKNLIINIYKTLFFFDLSLIVMSMVPDLRTRTVPYQSLWHESMSFVIILIFTIFFVNVVEKKAVKVPITRSKFKNIMKGLFLAFIMIVPTLIVLKLLNVFAITGKAKANFIVFWIVSIFLNSITQELLIRGYLYQLYKKYYSTKAVIIVNTILFISMNLKIFSGDIIYITNMLLMNILLCLMLEDSKSVLLPISFRFVYTTLSSVVFGSFSFKADCQHIFNCTFTGNKYLSGDTMKLEGSIVLLLVNVMYVGILLYKVRSKSTKHMIKQRH